MTETEAAPPTVKDLRSRILLALADPRTVLTHEEAKGCHPPGRNEGIAVMRLLDEGGWVMEGVPPVKQVLADARQFSDELILHKIVVRFFRVMILGAVVIPETPAIMEWLRDYIDGTHKVHGPLGKPMIWPDRLTAGAQLLRDWGFQPTPTVPPYVSPRPGGPLKMAQPALLDPQAPDPASVVPLPADREAMLGALLDKLVGAAGVMAVDRMTALRAMSAALDSAAQWGSVDPVEAKAALRPFALAFKNVGSDDDEEWAKMRLTVGDYRRAAQAYAVLGGDLAEEDGR